MMHAKNFMIDKKYREDCIDWMDKDYSHKSGNEDKATAAKSSDTPLIVQFAGHNFYPDTS